MSEVREDGVWGCRVGAPAYRGLAGLLGRSFYCWSGEELMKSLIARKMMDTEIAPGSG